MKEELGMRVEIIVTSAPQLAAVYALLGGAATVALMASELDRPIAAEAAPAAEPSSAGADPSPPASDADPVEIDAHGHPWSADLHASTKGKTKDGLWRMKVGVTRPDPLPGFPVAGSTGTPSGGEGSDPPASAPTGDAPAAAATSDEDDEFAAFRAAAANVAETGAKAVAEVPARTWTDADLGVLCNQAALKLGDPAPVKAIIASYVPDGTVAHSRHIPEDQRAAFAAEVQEKVGIEFAG